MTGSTGRQLTATLSEQQTVQKDDVTTQNDVTSVSRDAMYETALTSQHTATSGPRDDKVSGVDARAQVIEAENGEVQANMTTSTSAGEMMMMTYLSNDTGRSINDRGTTPLNDAVHITSDTEETTSGESDMLSASSNGVTKYTTLYDGSLVMSSTRETSMFVNNATAKNATSQSASDIDLRSTSKLSVRGRSGASTTSSSLSAVSKTRTLSGTGRGRSVTSAGRARTFTGGPTSTSSSADDTFSLWPRRVLLKSANTTDSDTSSIYWSSHSTSSHAPTCN